MFWDVMSIELPNSKIQLVLSPMFWDAMSIELPILRCNVLSPMF